MIRRMSSRRVRGAILFLLSCTSALAAQDGVITMVGRATDEIGRPLSGVEVASLDREQWQVGEVVATTGADGMFEFRIARSDSEQGTVGVPVTDAASYVLRRRGRATMGIDLLSISVFSGGESDRIDIGDVPFPLGVQMRGTVRDEQGKPVAGAHIEAKDCLENRGPFIFDFTLGATVVPKVLCIAQSDAEGRFELHGVAIAGLEVTATARGYARSRMMPVSIGDRLDLTLASTGFARGTAVDAEGKGVEVDLVLHDELGGSASVKSAQDGRFEISLPSRARYNVEPLPTYDPLASGTEQDDATEPNWIEGTRDDLQVALRPRHPPGAHLVLRVVDADSKEPIEGARAGVGWQEFLIEYAKDVFTARQFVQLTGFARDGLIDLPSPSGMGGETKGVVVVVAPGRAPEMQTVEWKADGVELEIGLRKATVVHGVVKDEATGKPARARVEVRPVQRDAAFQFQGSIGRSDRSGLTELSGDDGKFTFDQLPMQKFELVASMTDRPESKHVTVDLSAGKTPGEVELVIARGATLTLDLKAEKGSLDGTWIVATNTRVDVAPNANPFVIADTAMGGRSIFGERQVRVQGGGSATLSGLAPGKWALSLRPAGTRRDTFDKDVRIATVEVAKDDLQKSFAAPEVTRAHVRGSVRITGADLPPERLAVTARSIDPESTAGNRIFIRQSPGVQLDVHTYVDRSGAFDLALLRGHWRLSVIDLPTGVELMESEAFEVSPGGLVTRDLEARCGVVHLHLLPEHDGQRLTGRRIAITLLDSQDPSDPFGGMNQGRGELRLVDEQRELAIYLPDETCSLEVIPLASAIAPRNAAQMIIVAGGAVAGGSKPRGDEVRARPGAVVDVELKVPAK